MTENREINPVLNNTFPRRTFLAIAAGASLSLAGCGQFAEETQEPMPILSELVINPEAVEKLEGRIHYSIASSTFGDGEPRFDIVQMDLDGSNRRIITQDGLTHATSNEWTPGGKRFAVLERIKNRTGYRIYDHEGNPVNYVAARKNTNPELREVSPFGTLSWTEDGGSALVADSYGLTEYKIAANDKPVLLIKKSNNILQHPFYYLADRIVNSGLQEATISFPREKLAFVQWNTLFITPYQREYPIIVDNLTDWIENRADIQEIDKEIFDYGQSNKIGPRWMQDGRLVLPGTYPKLYNPATREAVIFDFQPGTCTGLSVKRTEGIFTISYQQHILVGYLDGTHHTIDLSSILDKSGTHVIENVAFSTSGRICFQDGHSFYSMDIDGNDLEKVYEFQKHPGNPDIENYVQITIR